MLRIGRSLAYIGFLLMPALYLRLWYNFDLSDAFFLVAFFIFIIAYNSKTLFTIVKNPLNIPFFIFFVGFSLSTTFSSQPIECFFALIQLLFCIYVITTLIYFCDIKKIFQMIILGVSFHVILLILYVIGILDIGIIKKGWGDIRISFGNLEPNIAARVFFIGFVIMIYFLKKKNWIWLKVGTLFSTLATISRTGLLALIMLFIVKSKLIKIIFFSILVILVIVIMEYMPLLTNANIISNYTFRMSNLLNMSGISARQRMYMYTEGPNLFFEKYFFIGTGLDNSSIVGHAHNIFISVAIATGIFGLMGYLLMYLIIFKVAWSLKRKYGILIALVLGAFVFDMFMPVSENRFYWFPFSLTLAIYLQRLHLHKYINIKELNQNKINHKNDL